MENHGLVLSGCRRCSVVQNPKDFAVDERRLAEVHDEVGSAREHPIDLVAEGGGIREVELSFEA